MYLQLKERNLLLTELTDQLTVARKKLVKEQKVREHIAKSTAPVRMLDKAPPSRREMLMSTLKLDPATLDESAPTTAGSGIGMFTVESAFGFEHGDGGGLGPRHGEGAERRMLPGARPGTAGAMRSASMSTTLLGGGQHGHGDLSRDRSLSPGTLGTAGAGAARRPSTSGGTSASHSTNLRHELHRGFRALHGDPRDLQASDTAYDSHHLAKQARITDDAGHRAMLLTNQDTKDVSRVISAINRDPTAHMSDDRMGELKEVRARIVSLLADKVVSGASGTLMKKKPTARPATAKAREESERGRALPLLKKAVKEV